MTANVMMRGVLVGFSIAAPVGPIGVLCIRRSMERGMWCGLATGLGAAAADGVYGAVAGFGLTALSGWLVAQARIVGLLGGLYLIYLGVTAWRSPAATSRGADGSDPGLIGAFASTFLLTLTNPMTILSFVALFTGLGIQTSTASKSAAWFVSGVVGGSALWWLTLSGGVALSRRHLGASLVRGINLASGVVLASFGGFALWKAAGG